jgi:tight adherence protein C
MDASPWAPWCGDRVRFLGIALLTVPLLLVIWRWSMRSAEATSAFGNSYALVVRTLAPTKLRIDQSVARRLGRMGVSAPITQDQFRREQLRWSAVGLALGGLADLWLRLGTARSLVLLAVSAISGAVFRDRHLTIQVKKHEARISAHFPQAAELLALAVSAGESPIAALDRLAARGKGPLIAEFDSAINLMKAGVPLAVALDEISHQSGVPALRRFIDGVIVTLERGTPIAETLRMQANDVREEHRRALLEASGRAEIAMMIPIVFLIMPITVLFALWPSITALSSMTYK